jgi:hypothetical protein
VTKAAALEDRPPPTEGKLRQIASSCLPERVSRRPPSRTSRPRGHRPARVPPVNHHPPTVCFLLVGIWLIGLVLLLRPLLARWLELPRPWLVTIALNMRVMTLFLWHMTAYLLAILALRPLGFGRQHEPTLRWWAERPLWIVVPGVFLLGLIAGFGRFEIRGHRGRR